MHMADIGVGTFMLAVLISRRQLASELVRV